MLHPYHHGWEIRLCSTLSAQAYLLLSKPIAKQSFDEKELLERQLRSEIRIIAKELGLPIKRDCLDVWRTGQYFRAAFIWPKGKPGQLLKKEKQPSAFSFLIRAWVRRNRN